MNESVTSNNYAQLITISARENDASDIESHLRKAGLPVRMTWLKPTNDLADKLRSKKPDIVFCDESLLKEHSDLLSTCTRALPYSPVLLLAEKISSKAVTKALRQRARDVVSANMLDHLHAVYLRELGVCRLQQQLNLCQEEVEALEERLEGLISSSEAAVITVQEGIIVDANPRFAELFGYDDFNQALGIPFLDKIQGSHQKEVKNLMSRCMKGRNFENNIQISALKSSGDEFQAELELKLVQFEGESAIELLIKADNVAQPVNTAAEEKPEAVAAKPTKDQKPKKIKRPKQEAKESEDPRIAFYKTLENPKHYPPNGKGLSLGYIIIDNSAKIKQQLGLAETDQFLGRIVSFLNKQMPGTRVFRLSTDEFVLIAPGKLFKHGEAFSKNFRKQISEEIFDYQGKSVMLTVSIAITLIDQVKNSGGGFAEARDDARALSAAGGNQIKICDSAKTASQTDEPVQWKELQQAVDKNRIRLAARPISSLEGDARNFYEMYPRTPNAKGELDTIENGGPQDTHSKLQSALDRKVIQLALGMLKKAKDENESAGALVPISSCSLEGSEELFEWLVKERKSLGITDQAIVFAISEEVLIPHIHRIKTLIGKLEDKLINFSISDCEGNEKSIRLIQNLPGHFLRLTEEATRSLCNPRNKDVQILNETVSIAREHGYKIIAAATGDAHSMAVLWQLGVNYVESSEVEEPSAA